MKIHYLVVQIAENEDGTMEAEISSETLEPRVVSFAAASLLGQLPAELRELVIKDTVLPAANRE